MKTPKMAVVVIDGRQEVGEVISEGKRTCFVKFAHLPGTPTIKMKKSRVIRLLFGDKWN